MDSMIIGSICRTDKHLFHYTSRAKADGIKSTGVIKQSGSSGQFGAGVYMPDLHPMLYFRNEILANNYGGIAGSFSNRCDYVVLIDRDSLDESLLTTNNVDDRHIYCYRRDVYVSADQVVDKPTCLRTLTEDYSYLMRLTRALCASYIGGMVTIVSLAIQSDPILCDQSDFKCPAHTILNGCECYPLRQALYCGKNQFIPHLRDIRFQTITLCSVQTTNVSLVNVRTDKLVLTLQSDIEAIDQIIDLQFRILSLESAEEHLVKQLFSRGSQTLTEIFITQFYATHFDLRFANFPNLECIHLGTALQTNIISGLGADIFTGLERLVQLNLNYLGVESMAENSLRFSTRRHLKVDLSHNWVTAYELKRSNISVDNTDGSVDVDLRYNKVKALPYYVFAYYCRPDYKVRINLLYNPIKCRYNDIKWVYEDRETVADHLYNVYCVNYNNRDLFTINETDFTDISIDTTTTTTANTTTSSIADNRLTIEWWLILIICIVLKRRTTGIPVPNFYHNSSQCYKISGSYITPDPYPDSYAKRTSLNGLSVGVGPLVGNFAIDVFIHTDVMSGPGRGPPIGAVRFNSKNSCNSCTISLRHQTIRCRPSQQFKCDHLCPVGYSCSCLRAGTLINSTFLLSFIRAMISSRMNKTREN
ncbi:unnamed protein product [Medioppia subpectinata]|uniref:Uncharacterized protein n=1 Tax=Medioppia subpectinata TaxID=1979941 RepID=A0A7R9PVR4_9ACAR|nr:unnamed protein product [Medioppia subpectinata]CAG2102933.1 unnamed protein product [Medioppia subpectinata]